MALRVLIYETIQFILVPFVTYSAETCDISELQTRTIVFCENNVNNEVALFSTKNSLLFASTS